MKVCVKDKVELHCIKNGVGADFGYGHVYAGDLYVCGICGMEMLYSNSSPMHDPEYKGQSYYIRVKDGGVRAVNDSKRDAILKRIKEEWSLIFGNKIYQGHKYTNGKSVRYVDSIHHHKDLTRLVVSWIDKENEEVGTSLLSKFEEWAIREC